MEEFWKNFVNWWAEMGASLYQWLIETPEGASMNLLTRIIIALILLIVGKYLIKLFMRIFRRVSGIKSQVGIDVSVKTFVAAALNLVLNIVLVVFFLLILGVDMTSMATIISSATVAIGLSLQDLISAVASGVVLLRSKHFRTGDYIRIDSSNGTCEGTVSSVGLIASTLETFENQHVVIPNNQVLQGVVTNYSTNPTRRLTVDIDVDYSTDVEQCKKVMQDVIASDKRILKNPTPIVTVYNLAEFSITMRVICYTKRVDYWDVFYDIREKMLLAYRANDISIPFKRIVIENYQGSDAQHAAIKLVEKEHSSK